MNILFVCTGNTCRSPMAEGYLNSKKLISVCAISRGIYANGDPISENSACAMQEIGIDIKDHISTQLCMEDIQKADKIFCMSPSHAQALLPYVKDKKKLSVLGGGIQDPFGQDLSTYKSCRDNIITEIDKLIEKGEFSTVKVESLSQKHIKSVAKLENICFSQPWSEETILDAFKRGTKFLVATMDGSVVGYVGISTVLDEGYITNVAVFPERRRMGVGTALLKRVIALAQELSLSFVSLEVRESNDAAISLYQSFGFKEEGKRKRFYSNPTEDALILTKRFEKDEDIKY